MATVNPSRPGVWHSKIMRVKWTWQVFSKGKLSPKGHKLSTLLGTNKLFIRMRRGIQFNDSEHIHWKYKILNDGTAVKCRGFAVFLWFFGMGEYRKGSWLEWTLWFWNKEVYIRLIYVSFFLFLSLFIFIFYLSNIDINEAVGMYTKKNKIHACMCNFF